MAIATATGFVVLTAGLGLTLDRHKPVGDDIGAGWQLRGGLGAADDLSVAGRTRA